MAKLLREQTCGQMEEVIEAFISAVEPKDSALLKKAVEAILKYRDKWREPVENPLGVFVILGYPSNHPYILECVNYLIASQHRDGGWGYYNYLPSSLEHTVHWITHLVKLGIINELK